MFNHIKKLFKTLGSRLVYLFVGLSFALVIVIAQAAFPLNSAVAPGTRLTSALWNATMADINALNTRVGAIDTRVTAVETGAYAITTYYNECTDTCTKRDPLGVHKFCVLSGVIGPGGWDTACRVYNTGSSWFLENIDGGGAETQGCHATCFN